MALPPTGMQSSETLGRNGRSTGSFPPAYGTKPWYALGALTATVVVAPMLIGGAFPWGIAMTALLAGVAALVASQRMTTDGDGARAAWIDGLPFVMIAWTAVQWVPLPAGLVETLSPEAWDAWVGNARATGDAPPGWMPLSVDPGATQLELAKGAIIAALFISARQLQRHGLGRRVIMACAGSIIAVAVVGLLHEAVLAEKLFGIYEPVHANPRVLSPLLNENHLAGLLGLGVCLCLGLAVDARSALERNGWALGFGVCALTCLLSMSRSGIIAMVLGVATFAALIGARPAMRKRVRSRTIGALVGTGVALALVVAIIAGPRLVREFSFTHNLTPKPEAAVAALPIIQKHPVLGVGRGGFSVLFVREHGTAKRFYHPENIVVQWSTEWGVPVTFGLFVILAVSAFLGVRRSKRASYVGAMVGLGFLVVHDLADFAMEMVGVMAVAAATFGAAINVPESAKLKIKLRTLAAVAGVASLVGAGLAASMHGWDVMTLERGITEAFAAQQHEEIQRVAEVGLRKHPAEPLLALAAAEAALRTNNRATGAWINRAQDLAPRWSSPHLTAARWLMRLGQQDQAMLEIRAAETKRRGAAREIVCQMLGSGSSVDVVLRGAPAGRAGADFLDRAAQCTGLAPTKREVIDAAAVERDSSLPGPAARQARRMIARGKVDRAIALLTHVREPTSIALATLAEAHGAAGDPQKGLSILAHALAKPRTNADVLRAAAKLHAIQNDFDAVTDVGTRLRGAAGGNAARLSETDLFLGSLYEQKGRYADALRLYESARKFSKNARTVRAVSRAKEALYPKNTHPTKPQLDENNHMRKAVPQP